MTATAHCIAVLADGHGGFVCRGVERPLTHDTAEWIAERRIDRAARRHGVRLTPDEMRRAVRP